MDANDFRFCPEVGGTRWARKAYGLTEACTATFSDGMDGFCNYATGAVVQFARAPESAALERAIRAAWVRTRFLAPGIACKTVRGADGDWRLLYDVPTAAAADAWARDTLHFRSEPAILADELAQLTCQTFVQDERRHNLQTYISPAHGLAGGWNIAGYGPHQAADARSFAMLLDHLLGYVLEELDSGVPVELPWGEETRRLAPTMAACLEDRGMFPPPAEAPPAVADSSAAPVIPFALPVSKDASVAATAPTSVSRVELDQATTARFRAVAKRHGATVTQLLNVLLALAEVQSALEWAAAGDSDQYAQAAVAYAQATHVFFAFTFVNHRHKLAPEHRTHSGGKGTPMNTVDGTQMMFDIAPVRQAIALDAATKRISYDVSPSTLAAVLAASITATRSVPTDLDTMRAREQASFAFARAFTPAPLLALRGLCSSSIGDYDALGLLVRFHGVTAAPLAVRDVQHACRNTSPSVACQCWQFDGRLSFAFQESRAWTPEPREMLFRAAFRRWIDVYCAL